MEDFSETLRKMGAREFQIVALSVDEERALSAIAEAERRGVSSVIPYALTLFDDPSWSGSTARPKRATNQAVEVTCVTCGGDRFLVHSTRSPSLSSWMAERGIEPGSDPIEEMKPCPECNANANTAFFRADGTRVRTP